jgi:CRP/FNR family transcriptional regulator, dissimilatory nitrate respiration regulator
MVDDSKKDPHGPDDRSSDLVYLFDRKHQKKSRGGRMQRLVKQATGQPLSDAFIRSRLLDGVPDDIVRDIVQHSSLRHIQNGTVLFLQDQDALALYLIESGWVKLFRETLNGDEAVLDVISTGHLIGRLGNGISDRHTDSAAALTPVSLYAIPVSLLLRCMEDCPALALNLLRIMQGARHDQSLELEHERIQSAPQRLGCFLLRLCSGHRKGDSVTLNLPIDKGLIAARLGMKPETFSRALSTLKTEIDLQVQGSTITIPSVSRLGNMVCGACSAATRCIDHDHECGPQR